MTTEIEDGELNTELQELYLESKQWIADLDFLDSELDFLKKLAANHSDVAIRKEEMEKLSGMEKTYAGLKNDMQRYLLKLSPLVAQKQENLDITLVETCSQLQLRLSEILDNCRSVKNTIFEQTKHSVNAPFFIQKGRRVFAK